MRPRRLVIQDRLGGAPFKPAFLEHREDVACLLESRRKRDGEGRAV